MYFKRNLLRIGTNMKIINIQLKQLTRIYIFNILILVHNKIIVDIFKYDVFYFLSLILYNSKRYTIRAFLERHLITKTYIIWSKNNCSNRSCYDFHCNYWLVDDTSNITIYQRYGNYHVHFNYNYWLWYRILDPFTIHYTSKQEN